MSDDSKRMDELIDALEGLDVDGPSLGGPYVGVMHNDVTRAIVSEGTRIIPSLIRRLATARLNPAIYIVFCLRELRAKSAEQAVRELADSDRFKNTRRDLTLDMQIQFFLRDLVDW